MPISIETLTNHMLYIVVEVVVVIVVMKACVGGGPTDATF